MLKKITQSFLALLLMMVIGVVSASAKTEKVHATFESPSNTNTTWNSETRTFTWSTTYYNQLRNIGLPSGDISKYKKLVVDCSIKSGEKFRILFYKGGSNLTLYAVDGVNEFVIKDELEKVAPNDYNEYLLACDEICLSGNNGAAPGEAVINDVYLETYDDEGAKVYATFESPSNTNTTWNADTKTFTWSTTYYNQLRNIGLPSGDISKYKKLVVDCSIKSGEKFRILFYKGGSNLTLYAENGVNEFIIKDALEAVAPNDYNEYILACDEICLSGNNGAAPGEAVINDVYLETYDDEGAKTYATFEAPSNTNTTWNGETKTFTWSTTYYNQLRNIGLPSGDISGYKKLVVDCSIKSGEKFRILFYKGGSNLTLYAVDGVNEFLIKDELEKLSPEGYNEYLLACDEICLSGNNGAAPGEAIINSVYLEAYPENESVDVPEITYEEDPGKPAGDFVDFTEAFPTLSPKIGLGTDEHPIVLGNGEVVLGARSQDVIADLSDYSKLTVVGTPGLKLVFYMNHEVAAQQNAGDYASEDEGKYVFLDAQTDENGLYELDLTQFDKQDLNAICLPWDNNNKGTVWYLLLTEAAEAGPVATYAITIPETENGTVTADVEEAEEGDKVTLTITPAEGYELDALSVLAGETAVQVAADNTFTMPAAAVTVTATFKEKQGGEEQGTEAKVADLAKDMFHKWTGFDAEATVADPDENGGAINLDAETDCPYGNTNVTEFEYADLSAWDYLTVVLNTDDQPRLFLNSKGGNDRIQVNTNDANYVVSNEDGVIVYNLAAIKAAAGFVHLNSIKASSWNTKANVAEMKLATVKPYIPVKAEVADLAADMFHKWTGFDAEATVADPDENGGAVNLDAETDCPYGNTNVTEYEYADLSAWDYLTLVVKSDNPRLFFNSKGGNDRITVLVNDEKYVKSNENGVIVYDLAAIKADGGFVHLNSIKASAWNTKTIVTEMKLATVEPYIPVVAETYAITIAEAENGSVTADVTEAAEGAKVTLTITPAEGYELDALSVAAGETPVEVADDNTFTMPAAAVTVTATFKAVESGEEEYLPKPETDPDYADFEEIAQDQGKDLDTFARTAVEEGADFNTYTASGDLQVAFKMYDIDVKDCDYVTVKFAQPAPKGWNIAFWAQGGTDNVEIPEGVTEYKYVFADDAKCAIKDDVLPQICVLTLWPGGYPFDMKVYGIYKHKATATAIEGVETAEDAVKDGKYFINGQIVIVKNGVKYNTAGVAIK